MKCHRRASGGVGVYEGASRVMNRAGAAFKVTEKTIEPLIEFDKVREECFRNAGIEAACHLVYLRSEPTSAAASALLSVKQGSF